MLKLIVLTALIFAIIDPAAGDTCYCYCSNSNTYMETVDLSTCSTSSCNSACSNFYTCAWLDAYGSCNDNTWNDIISYGTTLSAGIIAAIVVGSLVGLACCIGIIVLIVCLCTKKSSSRMAIYPQQPYIGQQWQSNAYQQPPVNPTFNTGLQASTNERV